MPLDPMKTDPDSGVEHDSVLTNEDCQALLDKAWEPMHELGVHFHCRPYETDGEVRGIVIVARDDAAKSLREFTRALPSYSEGETP